MTASLTGQVDATVQLLSLEQARAEAPELFETNDGEPYFSQVPAHGNAEWVDYWPEMVLIVRNTQGKVVLADNASAWHMTASGFELPITTA